MGTSSASWTFLQQFYIYGVEFRIVAIAWNETQGIEPAKPRTEEEDLPLPEVAS